jgi:hypothetical protein
MPPPSRAGLPISPDEEWKPPRRWPSWQSSRSRSIRSEISILRSGRREGFALPRLGLMRKARQPVPSRQTSGRNGAPCCPSARLKIFLDGVVGSAKRL